jgi:hypothetical protein
MNNTHHYDCPLINPTYKSSSITSQRKLSNKRSSILPGYSPQTDESTIWNKNILHDPNKRNQNTYKVPYGISNDLSSDTNISQTLELKTDLRRSDLYENLRKRGETSMTFKTNNCIPVKVPLRRAELITSAQPQGLHTRQVTTERMYLVHHYVYSPINRLGCYKSINSRRKLFQDEVESSTEYSPHNFNLYYWSKLDSYQIQWKQRFKVLKKIYPKFIYFDKTSSAKLAHMQY